jgi:hypothetical protein
MLLVIKMKLIISRSRVNAESMFLPFTTRTCRQTAGDQPFYGKGPHPLWWAGSQASCGKMTITGV